MLEVCLRGYGERKAWDGLLCCRVLVAVCKMAEFVCHKPDHKKGEGEDGRNEESWGRKERRRKVEIV